MIHIDINKSLHGNLGEMSLDVNFTLKQGDFLCISGKSGAGKTTLLRIIAGLETAQGTIEVDNKFWLNNKHFLKIQKREISFVFQDYALFDNMSVEENLLYVKKDLSLAKKLLELTQMYALRKRHTSTLSGGQKQRVAICRALMKKPKLLLLDEPLSALDNVMRQNLQNEILLLHKEFGTTTIMVSHDVSEIYKLASKVIILENGKIIKEGKALEVLLKQQGSQKFSFEAEVLDIKQVDVIYIATLCIAQQLVEIVISKKQKDVLSIGQKIRVGTKAFSPILS
ncbi:MAG: molybdenum ABC transporter ATP-binding protein [Arcobacter sp.]|nr:MAG: molybdenum ABC transporter ATP-binding protein [Arcobacter sp.]